MSSPASQHHHQKDGGIRSSSIPTNETRLELKKGDEEDVLVGPPVSSLTRRPALVPPKIMSDPDYENESERDKCSR